jgi:hypothetical protein
MGGRDPVRYKLALFRSANRLEFVYPKTQDEQALPFQFSTLNFLCRGVYAAGFARFKFYHAVGSGAERVWPGPGVSWGRLG